MNDRTISLPAGQISSGDFVVMDGIIYEVDMTIKSIQGINLTLIRTFLVSPSYKLSVVRRNRGND